MASVGNLTAPARVSMLCKLWGDSLAGSDIAERLGGVTRNAVLGKVDRLRREKHPEMVAADARRGPRLDRTGQVAEWMAENGGTVMECAQAICLDLEITRKAWNRICKAMGPQAV